MALSSTYHPLNRGMLPTSRQSFPPRNRLQQESSSLLEADEHQKLFHGNLASHRRVTVLHRSRLSVGLLSYRLCLGLPSIQYVARAPDSLAPAAKGYCCSMASSSPGRQVASMMRQPLTRLYRGRK